MTTGKAMEGLKALMKEIESVESSTFDKHTASRLNSWIHTWLKSHGQTVIDSLAGGVAVKNSHPYWLVENRNAEWYAGGTCCGFVKDVSNAVKYPTKEAAEYFIAGLPTITRIGLFASEHIDIYTSPAPAELSDEILTAMVSNIVNLQPLGKSRNDATRIWQMYPFVGDATDEVKAALQAAIATTSKTQGALDE